MSSPSRANPAIRKLAKLMVRGERQPSGRYVLLGEQVASSTRTSLGYEHLANLVKEGYIDVVLTMNQDPSIEIALSKLMRPDQYRVLHRFESADDLIARQMQVLTVPKVVKLRGDSTTYRLAGQQDERMELSRELTDYLIDANKAELIIVGESLENSELLALVMQLNPSTLFLANPKELIENATLGSILDHQGDQKSTSIVYGNSEITSILNGDSGEFDSFFIELDLAVGQLNSQVTIAGGQAIEEEIIGALDRGSALVSYKELGELVSEFSKKILERWPKVDMLAIVDDPYAPGGKEILRRFSDPEITALDVERVEIVFDRKKGRIRGRKAVLTRKGNSKPAYIMVIESIAFSGHTLELAVEAIQQQYENAIVEVGVLIISQDLKDTIDKHPGKHPLLQNILALRSTDRHEMVFPWGAADATSDICRRMKAGDFKHMINVSRLPWGIAEKLVDEERCSIQILTLSVRESLSFHRHFCRDQLFVALDEHIRFDICGSDLGDEAVDKFGEPNKSFCLARGDYLLIPRGIWHRSKAMTSSARLLEISFGVYDAEFDVERRIDQYGRADTPVHNRS